MSDEFIEEKIPRVSGRYRMLLEHCLGCNRGEPGYRNRYVVNVGSIAQADCDTLCRRKCMEAGAFMNGGKQKVYHATITGCHVVGLNEHQIRNAFEQ